MARYKYSENTKEVTDIYFDTETHGEFMGMEQGGEMKKVTTTRIKEKLLGEMVLGVDWQQEVLTMTSTPPVSPTEGDRYIVGTSATGDWTGYDDYFAEYASGAWGFLAPQSRMGVFSYNDMYFLIYLEGEWKLLATLDEITELRDEVQGYRDEILNDPGFQAVSADLLGDDNIGAVADALAIITAVNNNSTNINAVAGNETNINAVNANKANINAVNANKSNIDAVADNEVNINAVAGNNPNITAVAENEVNINAVNANKVNIDTVSNNSTNINTVATNNSNVTTVATSISAVNAVATDLGLGASSLIKIVADNIAYVTSVVNNITNVNTVAGLSTEITALGARTTEIDALYAQLSTIAEKENLANKKSTLSENSEVYYPNQKAVNDALNVHLSTIAEKESIENVNTLKGTGWAGQTVKGNYDSINIINSKYFSPSAVMGFEGRNLMDVFGTLTVVATFEALRASILGGDFSHLRLGDYIDLDSFTVANWHNGYGYDNSPELSAWDTPFTVTKNLSYQNTRVEIVGFDDYYLAGKPAVAQHHVTMMFKNIPIQAQINKTDTTAGGYAGSDLFANEDGLGKLYTAIAPQFGTATPRGVDRYLAMADGSQWVDVNEQIWIPTSMNIFGSPAWSHPQRGVATQMQFPLLALNPSRRVKSWNGEGSSWWFAEPAVDSLTDFCLMLSLGQATARPASLVAGVAPAFLI